MVDMLNFAVVLFGLGVLLTHLGGALGYQLAMRHMASRMRTRDELITLLDEERIYLRSELRRVECEQRARDAKLSESSVIDMIHQMEETGEDTPLHNGK